MSKSYQRQDLEIDIKFTEHSCLRYWSSCTA